MAENPISQRDFLSALWGPDNFGVAELTLIGTGKPFEAHPFSYPQDLDKLIDLANQSSGTFNVHMGVCLRREKWAKGSRGTKELANSSMCVWADIDFKMIPREEALKRAKEFPLKPSIVVKSGGGVHLYWLLKEPATGTDLHYRLEGINKVLVRLLGADPQSTDLARVLRVTGTLNLKYDHKPMCEISAVGWNPDLRYTLDDFDIFSPEVKQPPQPQSVALASPKTTKRVPYRELSDSKKEKIKELLTEIWIDGWRHKMALFAGGMFAHAGIKEDVATEVVASVSDSVGGTTDKKIAAVEDSYKKFLSGEPTAGGPCIEKMIDGFPEILKARAKKIWKIIKELMARPLKEDGEQEVAANFKVLKVVKFDSRPARYTAQIQHDCGETYEVTCETDIFFEFWKFQKAFFEATPNRDLSPIKQSTWKRMIAPENTVLEIRDAPEEATATGTVQVELSSFLDNKKENPEAGELKSFAGYNDKEVFFTLNAFRSHLKAVGIAKLTDREIVHIIKNEGWKNEQRRIAEKPTRLWVRDVQNGKHENNSAYINALPSESLFNEDTQKSE